MASEKSGCLGFLFRAFGAKSADADVQIDAPFEAKRFLFSKAEKSFFLVLVQAIPPEYRVFPKVRLADVLAVRRGTEKYHSHFNRISAKHFDFLICDRDAIAPRLAIELDDSSHEESDRVERDDFVNRACKAAGLPLLHVPVRTAYDVRSLARQISDLLAGSANV